MNNRINYRARRALRIAMHRNEDFRQLLALRDRFRATEARESPEQWMHTSKLIDKLCNHCTRGIAIRVACRFNMRAQQLMADFIKASAERNLIRSMTIRSRQRTVVAGGRRNN